MGGPKGWGQNQPRGKEGHDRALGLEAGSSHVNVSKEKEKSRFQSGLPSHYGGIFVKVEE